VALLLLPPVGAASAQRFHVGPARAAGGPDPSPSASTAAPLAITSFTASLPSMHQGETTYLNATATGGAPPYSYWYTHLPLGCLSQNASSDRCYPTEAEVFTVTVFVNDTAHATVNASLSLTVTTGYGAPPIIGYFYASPPTAPIDAKVLIYANATSMSSTPTTSLKYSFEDLPPGCASFNQTILQCIPTAPGTFHLFLQVTDAFGAFSIARAWLNVTGGASSSSTPTLAGPVGTWIGIGVVTFLVVVATILLLPRVGRRRRSSTLQPWKP